MGQNKEFLQTAALKQLLCGTTQLYKTVSQMQVLGKLGPGRLGPGKLGPSPIWRQIGPFTFWGPICHFLANWAPEILLVANWAPADWVPWRQTGPRKFCWQQIGPRQIGPLGCKLGPSTWGPWKIWVWQIGSHHDFWMFLVFTQLFVMQFMSCYIMLNR